MPSVVMRRGNLPRGFINAQRECGSRYMSFPKSLRFEKPRIMLKQFNNCLGRYDISKLGLPDETRRSREVIPKEASHWPLTIRVYLGFPSTSSNSSSPTILPSARSRRYLMKSIVACSVIFLVLKAVNPRNASLLMLAASQ